MLRIGRYIQPATATCISISAELGTIDARRFIALFTAAIATAAIVAIFAESSPISRFDSIATLCSYASSYVVSTPPRTRTFFERKP